MGRKSFASSLSILLAIGVVLMLFAFVLVAHHLAVTERVRQDRDVLLQHHSRTDGRGAGRDPAQAIESRADGGGIKRGSENGVQARVRVHQE